MCPTITDQCIESFYKNCPSLKFYYFSNCNKISVKSLYTFLLKSLNDKNGYSKRNGLIIDLSRYGGPVAMVTIDMF